MSENRKKRRGSKYNRENGKFHSKNVNHNPQAESARAIFGLRDSSKDKD